MSSVDPDDAREAFRQIVAEGLKVLKKRDDMTQDSVAAALGVKQSTVSAWKVGKSIPELSKVQPLAQLLGVSPKKLMDLVVSASSAPRPPKTPPPDELSQLRGQLADLARSVERLEAIVLPLVESSPPAMPPGRRGPRS